MTGPDTSGRTLRLTAVRVLRVAEQAGRIVQKSGSASDEAATFSWKAANSRAHLAASGNGGPPETVTSYFYLDRGLPVWRERSGSDYSGSRSLPGTLGCWCRVKRSPRQNLHAKLHEDTPLREETVNRLAAGRESFPNPVRKAIWYGFCHEEKE